MAKAKAKAKKVVKPEETQMTLKPWVAMLLGLAIGFLIGWFFFGYVAKVQAIQPPPFSKTICHHNPSQNVTLHFNTIQAWLGHLGTPHSRSTYDTDGACPEPTPTPTPVPPTPTPTPVSTIRWCFPCNDLKVLQTENGIHEYCADAIPQGETPKVGFPWEEGMDRYCEKPQVCETESWSCQACQNDPREYQERLGVCARPFANFCGENYGCEIVDKEWVCEDTCKPQGEEPPVTPTPTPTNPPSESKPSGCTENCNPPAPVCSADAVVKEPANFHVYRRGDDAILRWVATGGNKVIAYWKHPDSGNWEHSTKADNTGYLEIHALGTADWTFGLEQVNDCGGGVLSVGRMMEVVDGNTHGWVLFR